MSDTTAFHIIRRRDLLAADCYAQWQDPDQIARPSPAKRRTLLNNPCAGSDDEPVQVIATRDNLVIGRIDVIPAWMRVGNEKIQIFWGSHLYVPERFRNTLTGVLLILKTQALHHAVGAFGPSQLALPVYQKLKWIDHPIPRYIAIRRSRPVVDRYVGRGPHSAILATLTDGVLAFHRGIQSIGRSLRSGGLRLQRLDAMPEELDPLLAARPNVVAVHRSAAFINWWLTHAFEEDPRSANDLFLIRDRAGRPLGYFLNKVRFHETATHRGFKDVLLGSLQDWMIFDPQRLNLRTILLLAARELGRRRVHAIDFCTDDASLRLTLRLMGFMRIGALHLMIKAAPGSPLGRPEFSDPSTWWIRPADGDNFFV